MKHAFKWILVIPLLAMVSCQDSATLAELEALKTQAALEEANIKVAERWHTDLSVGHNWEVFDKIVAPDIIVHNPDGSIMAEGIEAIRGFVPVWESMVNAEIKHYEMFAKGDYVFIRWDLAFDHDMEAFGFPPTGNHVKDVYGMDLFLIKDGKIKELWQNWDQMKFFKQLEAPAET
jgi:predicted ester cyclase